MCYKPIESSLHTDADLLILCLRATTTNLSLSSPVELFNDRIIISNLLHKNDNLRPPQSRQCARIVEVSSRKTKITIPDNRRRSTASDTRAVNESSKPKRTLATSYCYHKMCGHMPWSPQILPPSDAIEYTYGIVEQPRKNVFAPRILLICGSSN